MPLTGQIGGQSALVASGLHVDNVQQRLARWKAAGVMVGSSYCEGAGLVVRLKPHLTMSASKRGSAR